MCDTISPRPRDQVTEIASELRWTQQEETVAVGQRSVLTDAVEKVEVHRLNASIANQFRGSRCHVPDTRANDDVVNITQRRKHGRADLTRGASHEDAFHGAASIKLVMARGALRHGRCIGCVAHDIHSSTRQVQGRGL